MNVAKTMDGIVLVLLRFQIIRKTMKTLALREKCANAEFFLVQIRENTDQKKLRIWTLFTHC